MNRWLVLSLAIVPLVFLLIAIMPDVMWQSYELEFKNIGELDEDLPKNTIEKSLWKHDTLFWEVNTSSVPDTITYSSPIPSEIKFIEVPSKGNIFGNSEENICSDIGKNLTSCCDPHLNTQYTFVGAISSAGVTLLLAVIYAVFGKNKLLLHAYALFALITGALAVTTIALWDEHMGTGLCGHPTEELNFEKQKTSFKFGFIAATIGATLYIVTGILSFYYAQKFPQETRLPDNSRYNLQSLVF
mgnify:CR=1 FL=1